MRWTELTLIPTALAMAAPVQWVACAGGPAKVKATTRSAISGLNGGMRDGRVLSRHSPAAPSEPNRSCQRQMTVLAFPVRRMISAVPCPAAVSRTISARQTCFCGLFRLATTAFNAARSVALSLIWVLSCIPQTRMTESAGESARESKSQIWSTSCGCVRSWLRTCRNDASHSERIAAHSALFEVHDPDHCTLCLDCRAARRPICVCPSSGSWHGDGRCPARAAERKRTGVLIPSQKLERENLRCGCTTDIAETNFAAIKHPLSIDCRSA